MGKKCWRVDFVNYFDKKEEKLFFPTAKLAFDFAGNVGIVSEHYISDLTSAQKEVFMRTLALYAFINKHLYRE